MADGPESESGARRDVPLGLFASEVREIAKRPTIEELRARLAARPQVKLSMSPAEAVRAERDGR